MTARILLDVGRRENRRAVFADAVRKGIEIKLAEIVCRMVCSVSAVGLPSESSYHKNLPFPSPIKLDNYH